MNNILINQLVKAVDEVQENIIKSREAGESYGDLVEDLQAIKNGIKELGEIDELVEKGKGIVADEINKILN